MSDTVIKLRVSDYEELIAHLSLVFAEPDFSELVPSLYQRTGRHMACNLAVRSGGRLAAVVGLFPIDWIVGGQRLRLAGIGGVSVHPDFRGQGLMRVLMDSAMEEIAAGGYHAACLGGNRRRYAHWGFEKAGVEASFLITPNSLTHAPGQPSAVSIPYRLADATEGDLTALISLYDRLPIRCGRTVESFPLHLRNWRRKPVTVKDRAGKLVAYACLDAKDWNLVECCADDPAALEFMIRELVASGGRTLRVTLPLLHDPTLRRVTDLADDASLIEASNWRIYDWPAVLGALMRASHACAPLAPGECVVNIDGRTTVRLEVTDEPRCLSCADSLDLSITAGELLRSIAGPVPCQLPPRASALGRWRPLPLALPMQDRI